MSSLKFDSAARSGLQSVERMATHGAKGVSEYDPVGRLRKASRWYMFTFSPLVVGGVLMISAFIWSQLVMDDGDDVTALDVISVLIISYIIRRILI